MSARINDGGPVHPIVETNGQGQPELTHTGMSLRDHFAGQALLGILSANEDKSEMAGLHEVIAKGCYVWADAMLKARSA